MGAVSARQQAKAKPKPKAKKAAKPVARAPEVPSVPLDDEPCAPHLSQPVTLLCSVHLVSV